MKEEKRISVNDFRKKWGNSLRGALLSPVIITVHGAGTHVIMSKEKYDEFKNLAKELSCCKNLTN